VKAVAEDDCERWCAGVDEGRRARTNRPKKGDEAREEREERIGGCDGCGVERGDGTARGYCCAAQERTCESLKTIGAEMVNRTSSTRTRGKLTTRRMVQHLPIRLSIALVGRKRVSTKFQTERTRDAASRRRTSLLR
jgi:hypothetical protein